MKNVSFLIDGFNVYHSIIRLQKDTGYCTKWLNYQSLCNSYISLFGKEAKLKSIYYFTALPNYLINTNPQKITRHKAYIKCLESTGIKVVRGRFKEKDVYCSNCKSTFLKHEEKETDVSIGVKLIELFVTQESNIVVIISGDTDLSPAIKTCNRLFPESKTTFAFPYARKNKELIKLAPGSFSISKKQYIRHQFPNPLILENGNEIFKPSSW